ncbi:MAG: hypothetical protein DME26_06490 [Verrucomicrobia bacterium]|nr:MAG: hypothetical protein DME26_06490 [Verrucomicrobiota bacterium]
MPDSFTIPAGASSTTITIQAWDDTDVEGTETAILTIQPSPNYNMGTPSSVSITILDNDTTPAVPMVTVTASDASASESAGDTGTFTVSRTSSSTSALTVNYTLAGIALNGTDYNLLPNSITIPAGASSAAVNVTPIDDMLVEGPETVILTLSADAAYAVGSPVSASLTIADNDSVPTLPTVTVMATDANASRVGPDQGVFTITRTGSTKSDLTVNYVLGGVAVNGLDYNALGTSVTIPEGSTSAALTIMPIPTNTLVNSETVVLTLSANAAYTVGSSNAATVTIAPNTLPISSIKATGNGITIAWSSLSGKIYRVAYMNSVSDASWTDLSGDISATSTTTSWTDRTASKSIQRYYAVYVTN